VTAADPARFILVTGATSGIGRSIGRALAIVGVTVGLVGRDPGRLEATRRDLAATHGAPDVRTFLADLASLASVRALAHEVAETIPRVDAVIHCAAVYTPRRSVTVDGLETMFATNVAAPFLLTNILLPSLVAASGRVLVVTAPSTVRLDFDDLQAERRFRSLSAFGATKAADLVFTFELARRTAASGVIANAVHPGLARTRLMRGAPAPLRWATWLASRSPDRAAAAIAPLVTSPEYAGRTGRFFKDGQEIAPPSHTQDVEVGRRLWQACAQLTGLA
jgi:NAD(P)-dependent dehydrogenase (short-subunit alcohol dehydrogenase family)